MRRGNEDGSILDKIWAFMILCGVGYSVVTGNIQAVSNSMLDAAKDAVELCVTLLGVVAFWCGVMEIGERSGLVALLSEWMKPLIYFLFPGLKKDHPAIGEISLNFVANMLGLGWAATPAGLRAIEKLTEHETSKKELKTASNEVCTFLLINISSLQLIPINVIAYRSQYGSVNPAAVTGPAIAATAVSTLTAVVFCKIMSLKKEMKA